MTAFDYLVLGLILASALWGLWRGVVKEILSLLGWVVALVAAVVFGGDMGTLLPDGVQNPALRYLLGMLLVLILVLLVAWLLGLILHKLLHAAGLGWLDRGLGVIFGLMRGVLVVLVLVFAAGLTKLPQERWWRESLLAPHLQVAVLGLRPLLPQEVNKRLKFQGT
ncbi:MAG: CvpA family protein [Betaproteobacteria bacterium]|nr:CvpA family protein [Betaproteobacteria bacterium]